MIVRVVAAVSRSKKDEHDLAEVICFSEAHAAYKTVNISFTFKVFVSMSNRTS